MAYELINTGPATPYRIHALIRLMSRKPVWNRQELLDLVEPSALDQSQAVGKNVLGAATNLGFIRVVGEEHSLGAVAEGSDTIEAFRRRLVSMTSGARYENTPNYRFNLFTAWYATLDDEVLRFSRSNDPTVRFNERMPSEGDERSMNSTKFNAWRTLAAFLGYGWIYDGNLIPDATVRLRPLLDDLIPHPTLIPVDTFLSRLSTMCPELDDGELFRLSWQHDRTTQRGRTVSLMVTNALRRFESEGKITLTRVPDAQATWRLFPTSGYGLDEVSHISKGASA